MSEPIPSFVRLVEEALTSRGLKMSPPAETPALARAHRAIGTALAPSWKAFLARHDGAELPEGAILSLAETLAERKQTPSGLLPVIRTPGGLIYLDQRSPDADGDWPVVELLGDQPDPLGTTFLRFVLAFLADDPATRAERDPEHADHWLDWAAELDERGEADEALRVVRRGLLAARPVGSALLVAAAEHDLRRGRDDDAAAHLDAALDSEIFSTRDEEARYDAAAERLAIARAAADEATERRCREILGEGALATASVWRDECLRALASGRAEFAAHAARVVLALVPDDADAPKLLAPTPEVREAAELAWKARELALKDGPDDRAESRRLLERAQAKAPLGVVLLQLARIAGASGDEDRQAVELARRAVHANPALLDAHFQLGDAYLGSADYEAAERAFRVVVERDPSYGLAWSKLALALLNQRHAAEALELAERGAGKTDDPFFTFSVLGDCLMEARRFDEAARAYEEAISAFDADHWTLHQAANAYVECGDYPRAAELFDKALEQNPEGCHQTLADYAFLKRRMGRIGDAVKLYRQAIKLAPDEPAYRDLLREAQKELRDAPN